jgi:hypothetical protein
MLSLVMMPISQQFRLYTQPSGALDPSTHVYANPKRWPLSNMTNRTGSVLWQHGDRPSASIKYGASAPALRMWTGLTPVASETTVVQPDNGVGGSPWSAVQYAASGEWGAALNTSGADAVLEHLTTTTLEASWYGKGSPDSDCVDAFGMDESGESNNNGISVEFEIAVPYAFNLTRNATTPAAIYISLSVYLRSRPHVPQNESAFVWYSTPVFDFQRPILKDNLYIDHSSNKLIISSFIGAVSSSKYVTVAPSSASSGNETWSEYRRFQYSFSTAEVERGIADGLARFPGHFSNGTTLPLYASSYCVPGFNLELEGTPGAGAGLRLRGLNISMVSNKEEVSTTTELPSASRLRSTTSIASFKS